MLKFFYNKRNAQTWLFGSFTLMSLCQLKYKFGSFILMSLCQWKEKWGGEKSKHIATINIFIKTFAFVIMDQATWNCFSILMVWFLISNSTLDDLGCCLLQVWFSHFICYSLVHCLNKFFCIFQISGSWILVCFHWPQLKWYSSTQSSSSLAKNVYFLL